jgi:hypothetical protein
MGIALSGADTRVCRVDIRVDAFALSSTAARQAYARFKTCFTVPLWSWIFCWSNISA